MTTLLEQLAAERRAKRDAINEALRRSLDPDQWRTPEERAELAELARRRDEAAAAVQSAMRAERAPYREVEAAYYRAHESTVENTLEARRRALALQDARDRYAAAQEATEDARNAAQQALRAYNAAVRRIAAAATTRRRAAKAEQGQLPSHEDVQRAAQARLRKENRH
jgi:colicin import membrane protein